MSRGGRGRGSTLIIGSMTCDVLWIYGWMVLNIRAKTDELKTWLNYVVSQYTGYTWRHLVDADLTCHMVLRSTCRFLPHTLKSFLSSFHTNNMARNHSDEISINEKEDLVYQRDGYLIMLSGMQNRLSLLIKLSTGLNLLCHPWIFVNFC